MELNITPINLTEHDDKRPIVIAGPCSAETEEQVMNTATQLSKKVLNFSALAFGNPVQNPEALKVLAKKVLHG